jgi:hypothetical protein
MSAGRRLRWVGYRRRFFGENGCNRSFVGVRSSNVAAAETPGGVHLGKISYTVIHRDEVILSEPRIADALALLADLLDTPEDSAVWHGPHVVCVVHGPDSRITWLRPEHRPAVEAA